MSRVITQTGEVKEQVTLTLMQGTGMAYGITFEPGVIFTIVVVSHDKPRVVYSVPPKEETPF